MEQMSVVAMPLVLGAILIFGFIKGIDVFDCFVIGAKTGIQSTIKVLPTLIGLILAVTLLRASGLIDAICQLLLPAAEKLDISPQIIPLTLLRPVSGGGATAFARDLMISFGPDSETGKLASVMSSATETTFYAVSVYFGATKYKKLYYTLPVALLGDMTTFIFAVLTVKHL